MASDFNQSRSRKETGRNGGIGVKEIDVIKRLQHHRDIFNKGCTSFQDMQEAINCIIGLKAENEALKERLKLLAEMGCE